MNMIGEWIWSLMPIVVLAVLIAAIWRSLSRRGIYELSPNEKLLRVAILVGVFFLLLFFFVYFVDQFGSRGPFGWDETTL